MASMSHEKTADALTEFRISPDGGVERRVREATGKRWGLWTYVPSRALLVYAVDSEEWRLLRKLGVRRPSPPSKGGPSKPRAERDGVAVEVRLTGAAASALDRLVILYGTKVAAVSVAVVAHDKETRSDAFRFRKT
jgi:hypothetical protein